MNFSTNFTNTKPDPNIDDQKHLVREQEMHTVKDYAKYVKFAFPYVNNTILQEIENGGGKYWTNKTLSYMRKDAVSKNLISSFYSEVLPFDKFNLIDATANIGGDTLQFALKGFGWVMSFEMQDDVYKILKNNLELYNITNCIPLNQKFEYKQCLNYISKFPTVLPVVIIIDPPFEINNNASHFNLSIDKIPIYYIVEYLLNYCCEAVILSMPMDFKWNAEFAKEHNHSVEICYVKNKDLKMMVISHSNDFKYKVYTLAGPKLIPLKN